MKFERTLLLTALLAAAVPAAAGAADHPHLFYGANDLATLRSRADSSHKTIADGLKGGAAQFRDSSVSSGADVRWSDGRSLNMGDVRDIGNSLVVFAFAAQLDQDPAAFALAKGWLMTVAGWSNWDLDGQRDLALAHTLGGAAIAYDMLYPQLSDAERGQVRDGIARAADAMLAIARDASNWWSNSSTQNHNWINHAALGLAALAVEGEVDAARTSAWLAQSVANAKKIQVAIEGIGDGTWHEGYSYLSYGFQWHLPFVEALRRAGRDDLSQLPILRGLGAARAYAQIPERPETYVLSSGDFTSYTSDEGLLGLRYAASRLKDGFAQAAADRWMNGTKRKSYAPEANQAVFEFLFYDPSVPAADLSAAPLDWYGGDQGAVVFRSGWDKGATLFALKSGTFGGRSVWQKLAQGLDVGDLNFSHDHADDNGFYLYAGGGWVAPEAQGYYIGHPDSPGPDANSTAFHNSMLVDGRGQLGSGVRDHYDNSGGYAWFPQREGKIAFHGSSDHFAFATGDGAKLYPSDLGVTRWDRNALFLDRQHVVLFDVVESSQPRTWSWLSHVTGSASQEGSWIHGQGENGQALGVAVVAPANPAVSIGGVSPVKASNFVSDGSFSQVEVRSALSAKTAFLTALVPVADASWASRPKVDPLDAANPEAGLVLANGNRRALAAFARDGGTVEAGGVKLAGLAGVVETKDGALDRALLVKGTSLAQDGKELLRADGGTELLEADGLSSDTVWLTGKELKNARVRAPNATKVRWMGKDVQFTRDGEYATVALAAAVQGEQAIGDAGTVGSGATEAAGGAKAGGGCAAAGPGDLAAIGLVLIALLLLARSRRRPAVVEVRQMPLPKHDDDDMDDAA